VSAFVDSVPGAPPPASGAVAPAGPSLVSQETFVEGGGFRPASADERDVARDGAGFQSRPAGTTDVIYDGRSSSRILPPALLAKLQVGWGEKPAEATPEKPAEAVSAPAPAAATPSATPPAEATKPPAEAAKPEPTAVPATEPPPPPPELAELTAARERLSAQNAKLLADLETARAAPKPVERSKLVEAFDEYIDNPLAAIRRGIAHALGLDDPEHAEVTAELDALIPDLTAKQLSVPLDPAQQASRDAAKARQALARDKRSRKAESEAATKAQTAQAEQAKVDQVATFIGNRLSLARTASDGKATPSWRDAHPLTMSMAQRLSGMTPERLVASVVQQGLATGRYDQTRANDDDYLIASALRDIESDYQVIADDLIKARPTPPTPTLSPPQVSPPSTAATTPPAPAPAATTSASQAPPQGHGGRTLTQADSSVAPATPPSTPAPATPQPTKKLLSRKDFLDQRYGSNR
jgi:hypothetical protein